MKIYYSTVKTAISPVNKCKFTSCVKSIATKPFKVSSKEDLTVIGAFFTSFKQEILVTEILILNLSSKLNLIIFCIEPWFVYAVRWVSDFYND